MPSKLLTIESENLSIPSKTILLEEGKIAERLYLVRKGCRTHIDECCSDKTQGKSASIAKGKILFRNLNLNAFRTDYAALIVAVTCCARTACDRIS